MLPAHTCAARAHTFDPDYQDLPTVERERLRVLIGVMESLERAPKVGEALRMASEAYAHLGKGFSEERLRKHLSLWKREHDWRNLVDKSRVKSLGIKARQEARVRHPDFIAYCRMLAEQNTRSSNAAYGELLRRWAAGVAIPVFGTWRDHFLRRHPGHALPERCPLAMGDLPEGWSKRNFLHLLPNKRALAHARRGYMAAAELSNFVARDMSRLRPMELLTVDDFRLDVLCKITTARVVDGRRFEAGIYPVVGLAVMDVATRKVLAMGFKPAMKDDDGKRVAITRADMAFLFASVIAARGLPTEYPLTILTENASAAFTQDMIARLATTFGDRIRVEHTGLWRDALHKGGWYETGGKPYQKGWIEAHFSLMHNRLAALPGQMGARYDLAPGDLAGKVRYAERMLKEARATGDDRAAGALRLPFLEFDALQRIVQAESDLMNLRTDHRLQGFDRVIEWRLPGASEWMSEHETAHLSREQLLSLEANPRMESPEERWQKLCRTTRFAAVPAQALAPLMSEPRTLRPTRGAIRFQHQGESYIFHSADLADELFDEDKKYVAHWCEADAGMCYLYRPESGAYITAVPAQERVSPLDRMGAARVLEQVARANHRRIGDYRERHAEAGDKLVADREHNALTLIKAGIRNRLTGEEHPDEQDAETAPRPAKTRGTRPAPTRRVLDDGPSAIATAEAPTQPRRQL